MRSMHSKRFSTPSTVFRGEILEGEHHPAVPIHRRPDLPNHLHRFSSSELSRVPLIAPMASSEKRGGRRPHRVPIAAPRQSAASSFFDNDQPMITSHPVSSAAITLIEPRRRCRPRRVLRSIYRTLTVFTPCCYLSPAPCKLLPSPPSFLSSSSSVSHRPSG